MYDSNSVCSQGERWAAMFGAPTDRFEHLTELLEAMGARQIVAEPNGSLWILHVDYVSHRDQFQGRQLDVLACEALLKALRDRHENTAKNSGRTR